MRKNTIPIYNLELTKLAFLNKQTKYTISLSFATVFFQLYCYAQQTVKQDSSNIRVKNFSEDLPEKYSGSDFDYVTNDSGGTNLLQEILAKFFRWLGDVFGIDTSWIDPKILEYIVYGIFAVIIIYLIVKYLLDAPVNAVFTKSDRKIEGINFTEETIEKVDFDKLIQKAVKEHDYRIAVRYLYLKSLQLLSSKRIIDWHFDKTNAEYQSEIQNPETKDFFKKVSYIYDYVWYGEFQIDEADYKKTAYNFDKLNQSIK
ncbi:protein of unknown function [Pustulibacterium marinum]|uniref:Protein-glutamine gamma-glutamyltransferase-like C-terminal domain-containing protein n=1 Tax=Pustulibacterium marinum TaxID=1224947 RepID=A0A1I7H3U2_9FLAO|nr:DUF4129 domain-containing protein [Pustulibacterium marinum]SFU55387.1 protein of unknown function [Pustulibacterium marinum]